MPRNNTTCEPWERQPKESARAFEAFLKYLLMGTERSLRAVGKQLCKSSALIERWSGVWNWVERVRLYENYLARKAAEQDVKDIIEMKKRQTKIAMLMQKKGLDTLELLEPKTLEENAAVRMITEGAKLERLNRGEATERTEGQNETSVTGVLSIRTDPYDEITADELRTLVRLANEGKI